MSSPLTADHHAEPVQAKSAVNEFMFITATFVVIIAGLRSAEAIFVPFLLSIFVAVICAPILAWLKSKRVPNGLAVVLIVLVILLSGLLFGSLLGSSFHRFSEQLPEYQQRLSELMIAAQTWLSQVGITLPDELLTGLFNPGLAMKLVAQILSSLGNVMTNGLMILLTVVFILGEMSVFKNKMLSIAKNREHTEVLVDRFVGGINQYMTLKFWVSLLTGCLAGFWCWLIGVDFPLLWALFAFLLNFVPTLGSILAGVPPVLLALVQLGATEAALIAGGYAAINIVIGSVLEPRFMGKGLNLSTLVVFLSLVFWGWVLGPVGMLLSIPLTMAVKIGLETRPETQWVGILLGGVTHGSGSKPAELKD